MKTLLLAGIAVLTACAQTPTEPPLLIQMIRGPGGDNGTIRPYSQAGAAVNVLGMRAVTGVSETWLLEAHDSFASIEDLDRALGAASPGQEDAPALARTMIAIYRPGWSYRPELAIRMFPKARYFHVTVHHVRPGTEFGELVKQRRSGYDRINLDRPDIAYHVVSGAFSETYVFLAPLLSLKTLDDALARFAGSGDGGSKNLASEIEFSRESLLLRVEPKISWVSEAFVQADPDFWKGKTR
jgi:hypothetical protein